MNRELSVQIGKDVTLQWCPTGALTEWAHHHFYYLPEAIAEGKSEAWSATMQAIMLELNERGFHVELRSNKKED